MRAFICDRSRAERLRDLIAKAAGLPVDGTPVPGGVHAPGKTLYYVDVVRHPSGDPWACPVDAHVEELAASSLIMPAEQEEILTACADAVELGPSWNPDPLGGM